MTKQEMAKVMEGVFAECVKLREAGQTEYAHRDTNAFANFERVAERLGLSREQVLLVYLEKHLDGIHSHVQGHRSQREDVKGRINDAIVYLCLLRGMVEETKRASSRAEITTTVGRCAHRSQEMLADGSARCCQCGFRFAKR